jgi:hypothetical protein
LKTSQEGKSKVVPGPHLHETCEIEGLEQRQELSLVRLSGIVKRILSEEVSIIYEAEHAHKCFAAFLPFLEYIKSLLET